MRCFQVAALILAGAFLALPAGLRGEPASPQATASKGATLEQVLRALEHGSPGAVVADSSAVDAKLQADLNTADAASLWERISVEFDRACLIRGRTVSLQRRFSHPEEEPGPEVSELQEVTSDLVRLTAPFRSSFAPGEVTRVENAFPVTLTPAQRQAMLKDGLPLSALTPEQRAVLLRLNRDAAYSGFTSHLAVLDLLMETWPALDLTPLPAPARLNQDFAVKEGRGAARTLLIISRPGAPDVQGRVVKPEVVSLPAMRKQGNDLRPVWDFPLQEQEVGDLLLKLREQGGPEVRVPGYATHRRLLAYSQGCSRGEILNALCDLWGWEVKRTAGGYRLERPSLRAPRDDAELQQAIRRSLPPALRHMLMAVAERAKLRTQHQIDLLLGDIERAAGADWKLVRVTNLDPTAQRRLLNVSTLRWLSGWATQYGSNPTPPPWLTHPERIIVRLVPGRDSPGESVSIEAKDDQGQPWGWGWYPNTDGRQ
jgi:hypothetical protein